MKKFNITEEFNIVPAKLKERTYLVGGYVRDLVIGRESNDIDFVVCNSSHEEMIALGFKKVGKDFPVYLDMDNNEFALARTERKNGIGHTGFKTNVKNVSIEEDLLRRDLTINSMAIDINGILIDPYNGLKDIKNRILRHTSSAFSEDPLRILRVARFYSILNGFSIDTETFKIMQEISVDLEIISKVRVFKEMNKAFSGDNSYKFFELLKSIGALKYTFKDLYRMSKIYNNSEYRLNDSLFDHSILALRKADKLNLNNISKFSALFYNVSKVDSYRNFENFESYNKLEIVKEVADRLKKDLCLPSIYSDLLKYTLLFGEKLSELENLSCEHIYELMSESKFTTSKELLLDIVKVYDCILESNIEICPATLNYRKLSLNEVFDIIENDSVLIDGVYYFKEKSKVINIDFLMKVFDTNLKKINVNDFIKETYLKTKVRPDSKMIREYVKEIKTDRLCEIIKS